MECVRVSGAVYRHTDKTDSREIERDTSALDKQISISGNKIIMYTHIYRATAYNYTYISYLQSAHAGRLRMCVAALVRAREKRLLLHTHALIPFIPLSSPLTAPTSNCTRTLRPPPPLHSCVCVCVTRFISTERRPGGRAIAIAVYVW